MAYKANIPVSTDKLSVSQGDILGNFQALAPIASSINTAPPLPALGFKWILLAAQAATPPAGSGFADNTIGLYSANYPGTTFNELFVNKKITIAGAPGSATLQVPMTAGKVTVFVAPAPVPSAPFMGISTGWSFLPSGMKMTWGWGITSGAVGPNPAQATVGYNTIGGFPGYTVGAVPVITLLKSAVAPVTEFVFVSSSNLTQFIVRSSANSNNVEFTWMAIGR